MQQAGKDVAWFGKKINRNRRQPETDFPERKQDDADRDGGRDPYKGLGFEQRLDYGAVGPATNLAARLCGEAKDKQILIAPRVLAKVESDFEFESVGDLVLRGFQRAVTAHNVIGLTRTGSEISAAAVSSARRYSALKASTFAISGKS